ncbi:hypothetical protein M9H77_32246 [Catharanthus roseus]|uniref:Uncharacterized protein n=1 Tax=Catharanthus roseus TaxID=4058 RepID=A0ACC0A2P8_CATRO|nr:hypothetical protein M9H77_32246 [Catharanthus roseus]
MEFIIAEEYHKNKTNMRALYFYILILAISTEIVGVEVVKRGIADGFMSLTVKFVNFFIAKSLFLRKIGYMVGLENEDILHLDKEAFAYLKMSDNHRKFLPKESKEGEKDSQLSSKKKKENFVGNKTKKKGRKESLITGA